MADYVISRIEGKVARIELSRLEKKNAITGEMYLQIATALRASEDAADVRVILIHGAPDCFTAGIDIPDFLKQPPGDDKSPVAVFMQTLAAVEKPVVAAVGGPAVGIGTTLLLHCDMVFAASNARFHLPFVHLGIVPEFGSSYLLPFIAGNLRAAELMLLGQPFTAQKAMEIGIVTEVVAPEELFARATKAAFQMAELPPAAIRLTKQLLKGQHRGVVRETIAKERKMVAERLQSPEAKEAISAFLEKRKPDFSRF